MKIYSIKRSADLKVIGNFNQLSVDTSITPYNVNWPNAYWQIPGEGKLPFDLAISDFRLEDDAIQTDHLQSSLMGGRRSIISEVYLDLIKESKIGEHDIFPIRILNNRNGLDYFIFRLWYSQHEALIDWDKTIWLSYLQLPTAGEFELLDKFKLENMEALELKIKLERKKDRIGVKISRLYLKSDVEFDDLFHMGFSGQFYSKLICTENFRNKIDGVVTGIEIEEFYDTEVGYLDFKYSFDTDV